MKLTKAEEKRQGSLGAYIRDRWGDLEEACIKFNESDKGDVAKELLNTAIRDYNSILEEAKEFTEGVAERLGEYYDDKSEKWQEGEKGEEFSEWRDQWGDVEFPAIRWDDIVTEEEGKKVASLDGIDSVDDLLDELPVEVGG